MLSMTDTQVQFRHIDLPATVLEGEFHDRPNRPGQLARVQDGILTEYCFIDPLEKAMFL
jgi:hypothetical protein